MINKELERMIKLTLGELFKQAKPEDYDKVIIYKDGQGGWTNVDIDINKCDITISASSNLIFSDDK